MRTENLADAAVGLLDVRSIRLDQWLRGHGFPDGVDLLPQRLAELCLSDLLAQARKGLEKPDAHGGSACGRLADLIERAGREARQLQRGPGESDGAAAPIACASVLGHRRKGSQLVSQPVDTGQSGEGVVDGLAQRTQRNFHELGDAELEILLERPLRADLYIVFDD